MTPLLYQYCPKIAVFDLSRRTILLCRRKGEADYDGVFSLIGGKMEHSDASIVECLRREKCEEVGTAFRVRVLPQFSIDTHFVKQDGNHMILPHFYAEYAGGPIALSDEYSDSAWLDAAALEQAPNIIENLRWIIPALRSMGQSVAQEHLVEI